MTPALACVYLSCCSQKCWAPRRTLDGTYHTMIVTSTMAMAVPVAQTQATAVDRVTVLGRRTSRLPSSMGVRSLQNGLHTQLAVEQLRVSSQGLRLQFSASCWRQCRSVVQYHLSCTCAHLAAAQHWTEHLQAVACVA